jgi:hypothetical protein
MSDFPLDLQASLKFLYYIAPQVIAVIIGGLIFQRYFVARANECAIIDYLVKGLDELHTDSLEYWNLETNTKVNRERARVLEQKIKGAIKSLTSELRSYSERYCKKTDFGHLMAEVADACTGGLFESEKRTPDSGRYLTIVNSLHRVKWELMRRKL